MLSQGSNKKLLKESYYVYLFCTLKLNESVNHLHLFPFCGATFHKFPTLILPHLFTLFKKKQVYS